MAPRDAQPPHLCEQQAGAGVPGGYDAIAHIHARLHRGQDVLGQPNPHQVAWPVGGQKGYGDVQYFRHGLQPFPHAQAADGNSGQPKRGDLFRAGPAQIGVGAPLNDAEQRLPLAAVGGPTTLRPANSALHCLFGIGVGRRIGHALVECHGDVRAQLLLYGDGALWRERDRLPVLLVGEAHAFLGDDTVGKREDPKSAAVGNNQVRPVHEGVQAPLRRDDFLAGLQMQMVGVGQHDACPGLDGLLGQQRLDRGVRRHRHEQRRGDFFRGRFDRPQAGVAVGVALNDAEAEGHL